MLMGVLSGALCEGLSMLSECETACELEVDGAFQPPCTLPPPRRGMLGCSEQESAGVSGFRSAVTYDHTPIPIGR
eukprot:3886469-Rhodomonas_salina.2